MSNLYGFDLCQKKQVREYNASAELYIHEKTKANIFILANDDINRTLGIAFRTPPSDSTGIQHILEHMMFCGSRKYPVKDVFVELLKGSLQIYLNAYTYLDTTCYLATTPNLKDFYNCMDIYLDSVFHPLLTYENFLVEGWRYDLNGDDNSLSYKGVVLSEMKGHFASANARIAEQIRKSLFPSSPYAYTPGGIPEEIPNLSYENLVQYHKHNYHPSNALIFLYGDIETASSLQKISEYLNDFNKVDYKITVPMQQPFDKPRYAHYTFPVKDGDSNGSEYKVIVNWNLEDKPNFEMALTFIMLESLLTGSQSSPLKKALLDSGYGDSIAGAGLFQDLRQPYYSIGLRGVARKNIDKVEPAILSIIESLVQNGIDDNLKDAALNRIQFIIRENNFGKTPQGIQLMLRALSSWCYESDIFDKMGFEKQLEAIENRIRNDDKYIEKLLTKYLLNNANRTITVFEPDPDIWSREREAEKERLDQALSKMNLSDFETIRSNAEKIKNIIKPEKSNLPKVELPALKLSDIEIPSDFPKTISENINGLKTIHSDIPTHGTSYLTIGFNLRGLPDEYISYGRIFTRLLLQNSQNGLSEKIGRLTGGVRTGFFNILRRDNGGSASWVLLLGKALNTRIHDLVDVYAEILENDMTIDSGTLRRMIIGELKRHETMFNSEFSHKLLRYRLNAHFNEAGRMSEQLTGISYISFLRDLLTKLDTNYDQVINTFANIKKRLLNKSMMITGVTCNERSFDSVRSNLKKLTDILPEAESIEHSWNLKSIPATEAFIVPTEAGNVGKAVDIARAGFDSKGAAYVITKYLWTTWFWDKIRVEGGAYESYCDYSDISNVFTIVSNRDPNIAGTIKAFEQTADYLRNIHISNDELTQCIIGAVQKYTGYKSPDARGHQLMANYLAGVNDDDYRRVFEQILSTTANDFVKFAEVMSELGKSNIIKIFSSENTINNLRIETSSDIEKVNAI